MAFQREVRRMQNITLIEARKRTGFTQQQVADKARISQWGYGRYEAGERVPNAIIANRIAKVLHSTSEQLFGT